MAVNHRSGRVVVELDPELKFALYAALAAEGLTLKDWFVERAARYVREFQQPTLAFAAEPPSPPYLAGTQEDE